MYQMMRYEEKTEHLLSKIAATAPHEAGLLLNELQAQGLSDSEIYVLFALASARWIDHHGPFIGHGTLNMAPLIQASVLLDDKHKRLALLQAAVYVLELFRNPNYGPYLQPQTAGVQSETAVTTEQDLLNAFQKGTQQYLAENLFVGLYRQTGGDVRIPLLRMGVQEYARNEHKLLIVLRTLDLLDMNGNWKYGEPLLRPAVQYLSALPKLTRPWERVQEAVQTYNLAAYPFSWEGEADHVLASHIVQELLDAQADTECDVLAGHLANGVNVPTLYEGIAQSSAVMLYRSGDNEEHIVTGILCILDMLRDDSLPTDLRTAALLASLSNQRTRDFKEDEDKRPFLEVTPTAIEDEANWIQALIQACYNDPTGAEPALLTAQFIQAGGNLEAITQSLMNLALTTSGPFIAIHAVKMIWGQYRETSISRHKDRWVHLASATSYIARALPSGLKAAERVVNQL